MKQLAEMIDCEVRKRRKLPDCSHNHEAHFEGPSIYNILIINPTFQKESWVDFCSLQTNNAQAFYHKRYHVYILEITVLWYYIGTFLDFLKPESLQL